MFPSPSFYSTTSKLPSFFQLVAVSNYDATFAASYLRKGAANAAGWPITGVSPVWTGEIFMQPDMGVFFATAIGLQTGGYAPGALPAPLRVVCVN
jgi:hypothetical protein